MTDFQEPLIFLSTSTTIYLLSEAAEHTNRMSDGSLGYSPFQVPSKNQRC